MFLVVLAHMVPDRTLLDGVLIAGFLLVVLVGAIMALVMTEKHFRRQREQPSFWEQQMIDARKDALEAEQHIRRISGQRQPPNVPRESERVRPEE